MDDLQSLYNVIAVLVKKLGGEVTINDADLEDPPRATVTRSHATGKIVITVDK